MISPRVRIFEKDSLKCLFSREDRNSHRLQRHFDGILLKAGIPVEPAYEDPPDRKQKPSRFLDLISLQRTSIDR
jgi:repressor of nif and glnA expression